MKTLRHTLFGRRERAVADAAAAAPEPPRPGQQLTLRRGRSKSALAARVVAERPGNISVEVVEGAAGSRGRVALEWVASAGLARLRGRVWLVRQGAGAILEI